MISDHCLHSFFVHHALQFMKEVYGKLEMYSLYRAGQTSMLLLPGRTSRKHCTLNYRLNMQTQRLFLSSKTTVHVNTRQSLRVSFVKMPNLSIYKNMSAIVTIEHNKKQRAFFNNTLCHFNKIKQNPYWIYNIAKRITSHFVSKHMLFNRRT